MSDAQNGGNVMERLTNKAWRNFDPWECCGQDKYCQRGCHDPGGCTKGCIVPQLYARLGAYEDTGLTPEEVLPKDKADEIALKLMRLADLESICSYTRLRELAEADRDGRVVVLLCKVCDTVWVTRNPWTGKLLKKPLDACVNGMKMYSHGLYVNLLFDTRKINGTRDYEINHIGKTVFLTREEAEAALEAMK